MLDTYEKVLGADADGDLRWRDEHSQIIDPADIPRFAKLGVIASMQPTHATSDGPWAETRLGAARMAGACTAQPARQRRATRLRLRLPGGVRKSDKGLYAAVTRQDRAKATRPAAGNRRSDSHLPKPCAVSRWMRPTVSPRTKWVHRSPASGPIS
ncbi:MAG: amidohydrolase family protein [Lysobacteraceae bacterium]